MNEIHNKNKYGHTTRAMFMIPRYSRCQKCYVVTIDVNSINRFCRRLPSNKTNSILKAIHDNALFVKCNISPFNILFTTLVTY